MLASPAYAQKIDAKFFDDTHTFLQKVVKNNNVDYAAVKKEASLSSLVSRIARADIGAADAATKQAFYINAYNLLVIDKVAKAYPIQSTQDIPGFFDRTKNTVGGKTMTLNQLEKEYLLKQYGDPRYHFVLVCGALGCPPITDFAYTPEKLNEQLEEQTRIALNNNDFISATGNNLSLSQIFNWYKSDFGGNKSSILAFINKYRTSNYPSSVKFSYYDYDWVLNDASATTGLQVGNPTLGNNASRYIVSSTIPKGTTETKIFNNLYTQRVGNQDGVTTRNTFFSTSLSFFYGVNSRLNVGVSSRYVRVRNDALPSNPFSVLGNNVDEAAGESQRDAITQLGPQIRWAPVKEWSNFSIQSAFLFAIGSELEGGSRGPFVDWNGPTFITQFFNDFPIGNSLSLFTEVDFIVEDWGSSEDNFNRVSTPLTAIFSYNPNTKITLYVLGGYSPRWVDGNYDQFNQYGTGIKYQFTPKVELELLYTEFMGTDLNNAFGDAATYNLGFRYNY